MPNFPKPDADQVAKLRVPAFAWISHPGSAVTGLLLFVFRAEGAPTMWQVLQPLVGRPPGCPLAN